MKIKRRAGRPHKCQTVRVDPVFRELLLEMVQNGKVYVEGLGTFQVIRVPKKTMYHNLSKRERVIPAYNRLKFTQNSKVKDYLSNI